MGFLTVDLQAAGLTHAKGKSDNCGGEHDIDEKHVTRYGDWVPAGLEALFQRFHVQAHPDGTAYWENCREAVCADSCELLNQEE